MKRVDINIKVMHIQYQANAQVMHYTVQCKCYAFILQCQGRTVCVEPAH